MKTIKLKEILTQKTTFNKNWKNVDTRRKIVGVVFENGTIWYPRFKEIQALNKNIIEVFEHNIQYPNIDKLPKC